MSRKILRRNPNFWAIAAHVLRVNRKDRLNDIFVKDAATYAHLRELDPELPEHAWQVIVRYKPQLSHVQWQAVRELTIGTAVQMRPRTFETTRRLMSMSARFAAWVWTVKGGEATVERIFTDGNIQRYIATKLRDHSDTHRWGTVRQLGVIAETLTGAAVKRLPAPHLPGKRTPFSQSQLATMYSWSNTLSTNLKRQNAWAILGLGAGAGLRAEELVEVRVRDVVTTDDGAWVKVPGQRARLVPVLSQWQKTLGKAIGGREEDELLFRGYRHDEYPPRALQQFLSLHPCAVRATVSRLRATWICTHLPNIPAQVLLEAAGFASAGSLDKYITHLRGASVDEYASALFGEVLR